MTESVASSLDTSPGSRLSLVLGAIVSCCSRLLLAVMSAARRFVQADMLSPGIRSSPLVPLAAISPDGIVVVEACAREDSDSD